MNQSKSVVAAAGLVLLCVSLAPGAIQRMKPTLYGRAMLLISSAGGTDTVELDNGTIRLAAADSSGRVQETHTDAWGSFAFYGLAEGPYRLEVYLGKRRMHIASGGAVLDEIRLVVSGRGPQKIDRIFVLPD
jgi:hypothetical protein